MSRTGDASPQSVHHIGITVSDIAWSIEFYRDVLGLTLVARRTVDAEYVGAQTGSPGVQLAVASLRPGNAPDGPSIELAQYVNSPGAAADTATSRPGNGHLCFVVDDLPSAYESLLERGVKFRSAPVAITAGPNQGGWAVYLADPDGFVIELCQRPRSA
ncbi:MAG TPA: VOC family protein [Pirellulales bacterium]|jgi:catechol 2,3-dioxygenase-like lactoylglutathione lyase family enzyme|nr:VOC family protein [Pirellulales bacterium]